MVTTGRATRPFPSGFTILPAPANSTVERPDDGLGPRVADVARLLRQQAALAAFGSFALGENDLDKVLTEAARVCALSLEVPFCKVCRYRSEENDLLVEAGVGWRPGVIGGVVSRADASSPQGRAFTTGEAVICEDLRQDVSFLLPAFYAEHGIVSTLDVPIRKKEGKPWGVLEIDNPHRHVYGEHDINFVMGFANVLAETVETSKRNVAGQRSLERMKDMVADRDRLVAAQARLLSEKATLAQELQHRVRNSLQLVYTMLSKKISSSDEDGGRSALSAIARRIMSMALVYDHLLDSGLTRTIDFGPYLSSLCDSVKDMENPRHRHIKLTCHWQPLMLDLDTSSALGLITVELLANSLLHAFPKDVGSITVSLTANEAGDRGEIVFADDGVGFVEPAESKGPGVFLVRRLMRQIDGTAVVRSDHGTTWTISFPVAEPVAGTTIAAAKSAGASAA